MDITAIAATSVAMHQAQLDQAVGVAVVKKAMDFEGDQAAQLIAQMTPPAPSFGHQLDVTV